MNFFSIEDLALFQKRIGECVNTNFETSKQKTRFFANLKKLLKRGSFPFWEKSVLFREVVEHAISVAGSMVGEKIMFDVEEKLMMLLAPFDVSTEFTTTDPDIISIYCSCFKEENCICPKVDHPDDVDCGCEGRHNPKCKKWSCEPNCSTCNGIDYSSSVDKCIAKIDKS